MKLVRESINLLFEVGEANTKSYELKYIKKIDKWRGENMHMMMSGYEFKTEDNDEYLITIIPFGKTEIIDNKIFNIQIDFEVKGKDPKAVINKGKLFKVLSTIVQAIHDYLKRNPQIFSIIIMTSKEYDEHSTQRFNLYKKYISKNLPKGWQSNEVSDEITQLINLEKYEEYKNLLGNMS